MYVHFIVSDFSAGGGHLHMHLHGQPEQHAPTGISHVHSELLIAFPRVRDDVFGRQSGAIPFGRTRIAQQDTIAVRPHTSAVQEVEEVTLGHTYESER